MTERSSLPRLGWVPASLGMVLTLTGCPLKDDYFIDSGGAGAGGFGPNSGGSTATGGAGVGGKTTLGSGGSQASGGLSAGGSATSGGAGTCSGGRCVNTSCGEVCVDLQTDPAHCGACDVACSAGRACSAGVCAGGWVSMAKAPAGFVARERAAFTSFDGKLFIFGGRDANEDVLDSAAIYDLATDSWEVIASSAATPSPRELATAVWTGSQVLVFGGRSASGTEYYLSGALYDPVSGVWSRTSNSGVPRAAALGGVSANEVVFWGGLTTGLAAAPGTSLYDRTSDIWHPANALNGPPALLGASGAFGAESLFVYGGLENNVRRDNAYRYDLASDAWEALPRGPKARSSAFGVFDGAAFYVWGGRDSSSVMSDGAVFGSSWTVMNSANAPSARGVLPRQSGWTFALGTGDIVFLAGQDANGDFLHDGGRYNGSAGWTAIPAWPSGEEHSYGVAALVGREVLVWAGADGNDPTATGERWAP